MGAGGRIVRHNEANSGYVRFVVELDRQLTPTDPVPFRISYKLRINSDVPARPALVVYSVVKVDRWAMRVQFAPPAAPEKIWRIQEAAALKPDLILSRSACSLTIQAASTLGCRNQIYSAKHGRSRGP